MKPPPSGTLSPLCFSQPPARPCPVCAHCVAGGCGTLVQGLASSPPPRPAPCADSGRVALPSRGVRGEQWASETGLCSWGGLLGLGVFGFVGFFLVCLCKTCSC